MKRVYQLSKISIIIITLCFSCGKSVKEDSSAKIEDSLVYIRGEDSQQNDLPLSNTGFIIAKESSWFNNKYFILTSKHSVKNIGGKKKFKAIPFSLKELYVPIDKQWTNKTKIYKGNGLDLDLVEELDGLDVSIMSFNSNQDLPVPYLSNNDLPSLEKLVMHGFSRCIVSDSQNKFFSYYTTEGEKLTLEYINRVEKDEHHKEKLLRELGKTARGLENQHKGIDLSYSNPSREGMSGSPIVIKIKEKIAIVGVQNDKFINQEFKKEEPHTCMISPQKPYSYGISMQKVLQAKDFPANIKKSMKIIDSTQ